MSEVSRWRSPELADLPEDIRARILAVQEKAGFVPNIFLLLARRPGEFRAFLAYHDALMDKPGGLTRAERELIVVATSALNRCLYCVVAHGAILRVRARDALVADRVATNWRKAGLSPRHAAMLEFAVKVSREAEDVSEADYDALAAAGFSDDDAWDIAAIAAFFAMSNRMANAFALRPNEQFFTMGR